MNEKIADIERIAKADAIKLKPFIWLIIVTAFATILGWFYPENFSRIAHGIQAFMLSFSGWYVVDRFCFPQVSTFEELKKGNVAYAIFTVGIMAMLCICIALALPAAS